MAIFFYVLLVFSSVMQSAAIKFFDKKNTEENSTVFNFIRVLSALLLFVCYTVVTEKIKFHIPTLIYGVIYGVSLSISMYFGYRALNVGPLALTGMLVSFSIIIPITWGVLVRSENLNLIKLVALLFLAVSMVTVNADKLKSGAKKQDNYLKWLFFVLFTFISNGICSIVQLEYANTYTSVLNGEFMVYEMLTCTVIFAIFLITKITPADFKKVKGKGYAILSGIANAVANFLTLILAGMESSTILFPIISAGTILTSLMFGRIVFKEKLKANHIFALVFGIIAIMLLKI